MVSQKMLLDKALTRSAIPACFTTDCLGGATPPILRSSNHLKPVGESRHASALSPWKRRGNNCPSPGCLLYFVVNMSRGSVITPVLCPFGKDLRGFFQRVADYLLCSVSDRGARRNYVVLICAFSDNVPEIVRTLQGDLGPTNCKLR